MRTVMLAFLLAAGASTAAMAQTAAKAPAAKPAAARPAPAYMTPVTEFIDGVNKNDEKAAAAPFVAAPVIIDEVPPHSWQGKSAFHDWFAALGADATKHKQTENLMTVGKASYVVISGAKGYVVVPGHYTYKQDGAALHEDGKLVFALTRAKDGWKIEGMAWAGVTPRK